MTINENIETDKGASTRKIRRQCAVCGKRIHMTVDQDGHYSNGHYFGKIEIPIKGTGENIKIGTDYIMGHEVTVVDRTGKKKKVEYWECNACYEKE